MFVCYSVYWRDGEKDTFRINVPDFETMQYELEDLSKSPVVDKIILLDYGDSELCEEEEKEELEQAAAEDHAITAKSC